MARTYKQKGKSANVKKYTVIYSDSFMQGRNHIAITKLAQIETNDLPKTLKTDDRFGSAVWFVFDGHPNLADGWDK